MLKRHIELLKDQNKPFSSSINYILIRLLKNPEFKSRAEKYSRKYLKICTKKKVPNMQVVFQEVIKLQSESFEIKGGKRLYHLSMREEIPKPMASYLPAVEDEYYASKVTQWRKDQKNDPKVIKRKTKKMEKDAVREIKKDNLTL